MKALYYESYKNRKLDFNQPVEVYRCLNRKGKIYSLRQNGLVVGHTSKVVIANPEFIINPSGKLRCIKENKRNVHAYVKGFVQNYKDIRMSKYLGMLVYNPYKHKSFKRQIKGSVHDISKKTNAVIISGSGGILIKNYV